MSHNQTNNNSEITDITSEDIKELKLELFKRLMSAVKGEVYKFPTSTLKKEVTIHTDANDDLIKTMEKVTEEVNIISISDTIRLLGALDERFAPGYAKDGNSTQELLTQALNTYSANPQPKSPRPDLALVK